MALVMAATVGACATQPPAGNAVALQPKAPVVVHSLVFSDGSRLKDPPDEVRVVHRTSTGKAVAARALLGVALLAVGALNVSAFSKDDLKGESIEGVNDRERVRNPVGNDFVKELQARVTAQVAAQPALASRGFKHPIVVGGGSTSLVYESLLGTGEALYQMTTDIEVYKRRESASVFTFDPIAKVRCADRSTPARPMADWTAQDHVLVRQTLDPMLEQCAQRVLAQLDEMLKD
jgi:hypothetical protein